MSSTPTPAVGERVVEVIAALEAVDVGALGVHLVAAAGVDEHRPLAPHDERPHAEGNPVAIVGRQPPLPQRAGHDAEHRAAIEGEEAVGQRDELEVAKRVRPGRVKRGTVAGARPAPTAGCFSSTSTPLRGRWMHERDQRALGARPRRLVDQPHAGLPNSASAAWMSSTAQRDVVQARAALAPGIWRLANPARSLSSSSSMALADRHEVRAHLLRRHLFGVPRPPGRARRGTKPCAASASPTAMPM